MKPKRSEFEQSGTYLIFCRNLPDSGFAEIQREINKQNCDERYLKIVDNFLAFASRCMNVCTSIELILCVRIIGDDITISLTHNGEGSKSFNIHIFVKDFEIYNTIRTRHLERNLIDVYTDPNENSMSVLRNLPHDRFRNELYEYFSFLSSRIFVDEAVSTLYYTHHNDTENDEFTACRLFLDSQDNPLFNITAAFRLPFIEESDDSSIVEDSRAMLLN